MALILFNSVKPVDFVNRTTELFPSVFVATKPGKPKHNLFLTLTQWFSWLNLINIK